jgi:protein-L-isoaspartate(D-aspartate) O-methyltransferase
MSTAFALPAVRPGAPPNDFVLARQHMLESQIKPDNIINPAVLAALGTVPREAYVPQEYQDRAYGDRNLAWQDGFLLSPTLCALLLEHIAPTQPEHVLVLESGAGYVTALAAQIFPRVTALFPDVGPAKVALNQYSQSKYENIAVKSGLLPRGWSRSAPYQAIIFAGAAADVADGLVDQLSDGGVVSGFFPAETGLTKFGLWLKLHGVLSYRPIADGKAPYLVGLSPPVRFQF